MTHRAAPRPSAGACAECAEEGTSNDDDCTIVARENFPGRPHFNPRLNVVNVEMNTRHSTSVIVVGGEWGFSGETTVERGDDSCSLVASSASGTLLPSY